jgi:hypothetical protein
MIKEIWIVLSLIPGSVRKCQRNKFLTWMEDEGVYSIYPRYKNLVSYLKRQRQLCVLPVIRHRRQMLGENK